MPEAEMSVDRLVERGPRNSSREQRIMNSKINRIDRDNAARCAFFHDFH